MFCGFCFCCVILIWICLVIADGMGTAEWRAAKSPSYYKRGDYVPGLKVSLIHVLFDWCIQFCILLASSSAYVVTIFFLFFVLLVSESDVGFL